MLNITEIVSLNCKINYSNRCMSITIISGSFREAARCFTLFSHPQPPSLPNQIQTLFLSKIESSRDQTKNVIKLTILDGPFIFWCLRMIAVSSLNESENTVGRDELFIRSSRIAGFEFGKFGVDRGRRPRRAKSTIDTLRDAN